MNEFENHLFYINEDRAKLVFKVLMESYYAKKGIFNEKNLFPDDILPGNLKIGSKEHALFYFYSVLGDARVKSSVNYQKFRRLHEKDMKYFNPYFIAKQKYPKTEFELVEDGTLEYILGMEIGNPTPVRLARYMISSSKRIIEIYKGNPLNIFDGVKDVKQAREKIIKEVDGYGSHLSSLFLTFCIKHNLMHFDNDNSLLPKIDFHDVTLAFAFGILVPKFKDTEEGIRRDKCTDKLQNFLSYFAQKYNYNVIDLDSALWALGSHVCTKLDWLECWNKCPVKEYCHVKPGSDNKKKKNGDEITYEESKFYPFKESRIKNIGDLQDLFIPSFSDRDLL